MKTTDERWNADLACLTRAASWIEQHSTTLPPVDSLFIHVVNETVTIGLGYLHNQSELLATLTRLFDGRIEHCGESASSRFTDDFEVNDAESGIRFNWHVWKTNVGEVRL